MKSKERLALEDKDNALRSECEEKVASMVEDAEKQSQLHSFYEAAENIRDLYEAYVTAGFTEEQAWELLKITMTNTKTN